MGPGIFTLPKKWALEFHILPQYICPEIFPTTPIHVSWNLPPPKHELTISHPPPLSHHMVTGISPSLPICSPSYNLALKYPLPPLHMRTGIFTQHFRIGLGISLALTSTTPPPPLCTHWPLYLLPYTSVMKYSPFSNLLYMSSGIPFTDEPYNLSSISPPP